MHVVFAASEAVPFCKTGGLADVAGALPKALGRLGARVSLFLPRYRATAGSGIRARPAGGTFAVPLAGERVEGRLLRAEAGGVEAWLVDCPRFFDREELYGEEGRDYDDNALRFAFFCRAVLEGCRLAGLKPDVLHGHDWQAGLLAAYLRSVYGEDPAWKGTGSVFTVHNLAYQGVFPREAAAAAGLPESELSPERLEYHGSVCYLKAGLVYSDRINTVSPGYAREILRPESGRGLDGVLRARAADLSGVLNGLDVEAWDPRTDPVLPRRYGPGDLEEGKAACKAALQRACGFAEDPAAPLIGSVSRLDPQKGLDLALEVLPEFLDGGAQFAALGSGDPELKRRFQDMAAARPDRFHARHSFDDPFARLIYSGCDVFLMPSRFEPCGLGQMIAMRYGALPVGVRTGGLADTIPPHGFLAEEASAPALRAALRSAIEELRDRKGWGRRARGAMSADFSWDRSAGEYLKLYRAAVRRT